VNSEAVASLPAYNSPKATAPAPYSSSYQYNDHNSSTTMTSCPTHGFATTSSVASSGSVQNNVTASSYDTRVAIDSDYSSQIASERI
ncbi:hypothetical protein WUBG_18002, partial [Wuchereria bancrofti]